MNILVRLVITRWRYFQIKSSTKYGIRADLHSVHIIYHFMGKSILIQFFHSVYMCQLYVIHTRIKSNVLFWYTVLSIECERLSHTKLVARSTNLLIHNVDFVWIRLTSIILGEFKNESVDSFCFQVSYCLYNLLK